jgi:hypothetical protein
VTYNKSGREISPAFISEVLSGLRGSGDLVSLKALGADLHPEGCARDHGSYRLNVRLEPSLGAGCAERPLTGVYVPDILTAQGSLVTNRADV